jgi:Putative peptidoglycan binding domain
MTADRANPNGPPAPDAADGRNDDVSQPSMAELSRRLGERAARQRAVDPAAAKAAQRAALEAYEQARERRLIVGLSVAVAAVIGAGIVYLATTVGSGPVPPSPEAAARPEPASPLESTAAAPAPAPLDSASPSPAPSSPALEASVATPAVEPAPNQVALRRDEMREVQARLRSFGFNPGPVDGVPGLMTEDAVQHYQRHRGQRQTGMVDRDLLEQLRQDPAPQVAQPAARPDARAARSPAPRRADPFEPVRAAGERFGQWLRSLSR